MYIYNGKLNWFKLAVNENVTFVFFGGFTAGQRVLACWQWTTDTDGKEKVNTVRHCTINNGSLPSKLTITDDHFTFDCSVSSDLSSLKVNMRNENGDRDPSGVTTLTNVYAAHTVYSSVVYEGKLDWWSSCRNEMVIVVLPDGVTAGSPVGMYYQWTQTSEGVKKQNYAVTTTFKTSGLDAGGFLTATYGGQFYTFTITLASSGQTLSLDMTNPSGSKDPKSPYTLTLVKTVEKETCLQPMSMGIYRIRELLGTKYWELAPDNFRVDRTGTSSRWVLLKESDTKCDAQKWMIAPWKGENGQAQPYMYTITCVGENGTTLVRSDSGKITDSDSSAYHAPYGYPVGSSFGVRQNCPVWAILPMSIDGYEFKRIHPTRSREDNWGVVEVDELVCEANGREPDNDFLPDPEKLLTEIVRFNKEAEKNILAPSQDWVFEPADLSEPVL